MTPVFVRLVWLQVASSRHVVWVYQVSVAPIQHISPNCDRRNDWLQLHRQSETVVVSQSQSGSGFLPEAAGGLLQQSAVAQDLELLADFVPDVPIGGIEFGQFWLEGVDFVVGEDGIRQRIDAA